MKTIAIAVAVGLATLLASVASLAHTMREGTVEIIHPWAEPGHSPEAMAYPTLADDGDTDLVLESISTEASRGAVFMIAGWEVSEIVIPPGEILDSEVFAIRLRGLTRELRVGEYFGATLHVAGQPPMIFRFVVGADTDMPAMDHSGMSHEPAKSEMPVMDHSGMTHDPAVSE